MILFKVRPQIGVLFSRWRTLGIFLLSMSLVVEVNAINYRPRFSLNAVITSVVENSPVGTSIAKISDYAIDDEGDTMTYSLDVVGLSYCTINPINGIVTLKASLDREIQERVTFNAYAEDNFEGGGATRRASLMVFIYVLDVNEWPPEFKGTPYTASVSENASIGLPVLKLSATDKDQGSNADYVFEFKSGSQIPQFSLDTHSGEIKVAGQLDYEAVNRYTLSVVAKDKGQPSLSSETRVIIDITDIGDTSPTFTPSSSYETSVNENLQLDSKLIKVTAVDGDKGVNNAIGYQIYSGNDAMLFTINPATGDIKVNGTLDRENTNVYSLKIKAYEIPEPSSFAIATVAIQLNDMNDNSPTFDSPVYTYTIDEDRPLGFILSPNLKATDKDSSIKNNAFRYSITDPSGNFVIGSTSGQLTVNGKLDYETQQNYSFMVIATETLSDEKLAGNATIKVILRNVNDNSPIFNKTKYIFNITENSPVGKVVGTIKATDADAGTFGNITYSISISSSASPLLSIDPISGILTVQKIPDYEAANSQAFDVIARDGGASSSRSSTVRCTVYIHDQNDNDPVFDNLPATVYVKENRPGHRIFTAKASDKDSERNGALIYQLQSSSETEFTLDGITGELNTTKPFDHEGTRNNFQLKIMAFDNGVPRRNVTQVLTVVVQDENDHRPVFNQSIYNASIMENSKIGSLVIKLDAMDSDSGLNSKISYSIGKGNERNTFFISSTGEVRTQDSIDRETRNSYELLVYANDQGTPSLSTNATLFITIADMNDNYPNFKPVSYSVKVNETAAIGTEVVALTTEDKDIGENARVSYTIISGNNQARFRIIEDTGRLLINQSLDWETTTNYILNMKAEDHGIPSNSRTAFVTIEVIDNNDNAPVFTASRYRFQIYENIPEGRSVGRVNAEDKDGKLPPNRNGVVKYFIASGNEKGNFKIDENIGIISTNSSIDRELSSFYNLTITAIDGGVPVKFTNIFAGIEILDLNDNQPIFANKTYTAVVYENATVGSYVKQVFAADADAGINAKIAYDITSGNIANNFAIDAQGRIFVSKALDRETVANYSLTISAKDGGSPQNSNSVVVFIKLLDVNDNRPLFLQSSYIAYALEERPAGLLVTQVKATDADEGSNSLITYTIVSSTPADVFAINITSGEISTTSKLDRETHHAYNLNISAADHGAVPHISYVALLINVADVNDHKPRITNLPNRTNISEDARVGMTLYDVAAIDLDAAQNAELSFSIVSGAGQMFSVNKITGAIKVLRALDREIKDSYTITINVTDNGSPMLWAYSTLEVTVTDINDNAPIFYPDPILNVAAYTVSIPEGAASINAVIIDVNATDKDLGTNGVVRYSIFSGNGHNYFAINSESGQISVKSMIDRESNSVVKNVAGLGMFTLTIMASDQADASQKSATTTVTVFITDVNDNAPEFSKAMYFAGVSEGADVSTRVLTVVATDRDIGLNGRVKYSIIGGNVNGDFVFANPYDGAITLARLLNTEKTPEYNLTVMATDDGDVAGGVSKNSTAQVMIKIGDLNDNDPVFNQSSYSAKIKENISSKHRVITVLATDADQGSNGEVWYQITAGNADTAFHVDNKTGAVFAVLPLDREIVSKYTLTVKAEDGGTPSTRKALVEVVIEVEDVNDNPPTFQSDIYVGHIKENSARGTAITLSPTLLLEDADTEAKSMTVINLSGSGAGNFSINSTSLVLQSSKLNKLDRESQSIFYILMQAVDGDGLSSKANLIIVVDDANDNRPLFNQSQFNVSLRENAAVGSLVFTAKATDLDAGSNSEITYSIRGGEGKLSLNRTTGVVQLSSKLDREIQDHYKVTIVATDLGKPPLESQTILDLTITDVIDSAPYFEPSIVELKVNETTPINSILYTIKAKDLDLNDRLTYNLTSGSKTQFHLDPVSGELKLAAGLDRENTSLYQLNIMAIDSASLMAAGNGLTVRINVLDANDNSPRFLQPYYLNDVVENTLEGTIIMTVLASDPDQGSNGQISYSIQQDTAGLLRIDSRTGLISKHGIWKITPGGYLNFTVIARDGGNPPRYGSVACSIRWITINAVNPRFNQSSYSVTLAEDAVVGGEVIKLTAYKKGVIESVSYSLTGGKGNFVIERNSGIIRIANPLDRELQDRFAITVTATDNQALTGVTTVTITVQDVNDNSPVFSSETYLFSVSEDLKTYSEIGSVLAVDKDVGENSTIAYSIVSGNNRFWFSIDQNNGTITTARVLDREKQENVFLKIMAQDRGIDSRSANASVQITILDVNDNAPTFSKNHYNASVSENVPGDTQVFQISALDGDKGQNGSISYSIQSGNELGYFYVGKTTGSINVAKQLDHEKVHSFVLTLQATDNGIPQRLTSTAVHITIIDVNDNKPRFLSPSYFFSVKEDIPIGHAIGKVQAEDTDSSFDKIYYRIIGHSSSSVFSVLEINGTIILAKALDREVKALHVLTIEAYNKDENGNNSLSSSVQVSIQVSDVNDHRPTFPPSCCKASVYENANIGDVVLRVAAEDADAGTNKDISYAIVLGDEKGVFRIGQVSGDISVQATLNREFKSKYDLIVSAKDHGTPPLSHNATVQVNVLDVNDVKPVFQKINISAVLEDSQVGTLVATIVAMDRDEGENGRVSYEIIAGNDAGFFVLDSITGRLKIAKLLNFEKTKRHTLRIMARDHGNPSLSTIETFVVTVANVNDNVPTFSSGQVDAAVSENMPPGSSVATIEANDADKDDIFFYIREGNTDLFEINENSGLITTRKILDREETSMFILVIEATNIKKSANSVKRLKRADTSTNKNSIPTQKVVVRVTDQNDNPPRFAQKEYRAGVSENAKYGTSVIQLIAIDADSGINSSIVFSVIGGNPNGPFTIDAKTGWIQSAQLFNGKIGQHFDVSVLAQDNGGKKPNFNDTVLAKIFVLTDSQRVVLTMRVDPQLVRDNQAEFIRVLQNMTSFKINIDDIQYSKKNGVYDTSSTDLTFHAVDPVTNRIQERDVVIKALERNEANYKAFFDKWKVQSIKPIVVSKTSSQQDDNTSILIGVAAGLFLLVVPFIFALCYLRRKQRRKLKAATASAKEADATLELEHIRKLHSMVSGSVSGKKSNASQTQASRSLSKASERFYPIWIEPSDDTFDSVSSSASYFGDNNSLNTTSNTKTLTTDILMMPNPYLDDIDVDNYLDSEDLDHVDNVSDLFDSLYDESEGDTVLDLRPTHLPPSREELLLRASLQPLGTLENNGMHVTSI